MIIFGIMLPIPMLVIPMKAGTVVIQNDIPQIEQDEISLDEQDMLDSFQVQETSLFWQWFNTLGSTMIARFTYMKRALQKKYNQLKDKWLVSANNAKQNNNSP